MSDPGGSPTNDMTEDSEMKLKHQQIQIAIPAGEDENEYMLCAYGDISLSNISFVPGPLAALSPEKKVNKPISPTSRAIQVNYLGLFLCQ